MGSYWHTVTNTGTLLSYEKIFVSVPDNEGILGYSRSFIMLKSFNLTCMSKLIWAMFEVCASMGAPVYVRVCLHADGCGWVSPHAVSVPAGFILIEVYVVSSNLIRK